MTKQNDVLLTVSGVIPPNILAEIADGKRPRTDYIEMSNGFGADLIDYSKAIAKAGPIGKVIKRIGGNNALLAWHCFRMRKRYKTIFTDGEQIGLPYALYMRLFGWADKDRPDHLMITHLISTKSKMWLTGFFKLHRFIDLFLCYSTRQQEIICETWQLPKERAPFTPFMVDQNFFSPEDTKQQPDIVGITDSLEPYICAVGLEFRDYPTLMEAVKDLEINVVIAAGSPWSKRDDQTNEAEIPRNVLVKRFTQWELRKLYEKSEFFVMPLLENDFQAGITAMLEAMSMEKAQICTSTKGQIDVVVDQENGIYVKPNDPAGLRQAILDLMSHPEKSLKMGKNGRQLIENYMNLDLYVKRLNSFILQLR
ncbi:MAG: glycosyltransferase family 4 protein [Chloroflexota bacterium]